VLEPSLDLRQGLRVRIEVVDIDAAGATHERASIAPAGQRGDEVAGRHELDVHVEALLQLRQGARRVSI
jgi:hypothetical protein